MINFFIFKKCLEDVKAISNCDCNYNQ